MRGASALLRSSASTRVPFKVVAPSWGTMVTLGARGKSTAVEAHAHETKRLLRPRKPVTEKALKKLNARTNDQRFTDLVNNYFTSRPMLTRVDKDPKQLQKEWKLAQAYDRLKTIEWEKAQKDQTRKRQLIDDALEALEKIDPQLAAIALSTPADPIPIYLRAPTLTPPVADYSPGYGFPIEGTEEDEPALLKALGMVPTQKVGNDERELKELEVKQLQEKRKKSASHKGRLIG
eukprot:GGOE01036315.1.p2 GENE.GGOE01036315.1~~GGOE01036315.1.p2  ORF type:complete len:241 (+),score=66.89 GGOE01036315.1:23-724(+)